MKMNDEIFNVDAGIFLSKISDHLQYFVRYPVLQSHNRTREIKVYPNEQVALEGLRQFLRDHNLIYTI